MPPPPILSPLDNSSPLAAEPDVGNYLRSARAFGTERSPVPRPAYAELYAVSNFSFLRGASHPEELVIRAVRLGYRALAITDECSFAGVVRAHSQAKTLGLHLIIGCELQLLEGLRLVLLVTDRTAYGELSTLISTARRAAPKGDYRVEARDLEQGLDGCLALLLPDMAAAGLVEARCERNSVLAEPSGALWSLAEQCIWLARHFPQRAWMGVQRLRRAGEREGWARLAALSKAYGLPMLAAGGVCMHSRSRRMLSDTLNAVRLGCTVAGAGRDLPSNAERALRSRRELGELYPADLLEETLKVASRCQFSLDQLRYEYPRELTPSGFSPSAFLRQLTRRGMRWRWPDGVPGAVKQQIEHELDLIEELGYEPYFLTVYDLVRFARSRNILCQGRGSAANSAVCFVLGITEVDPARMSMLFERFISRERNEPPDIDVDFEHERREEVIQYIYEKYGRHRAALTATVITYRPRSAVRDLGKALGLDLTQVDALAKSLAWWDGQQVVAERFGELGLDANAPVMRHLRGLLDVLIGFPRHLSQHTGGFVIARNDLRTLVPVENAAMPERTVIQWDKNDLERLGLLKVDVLALGMLTAIRKGLALINAFRGSRLGMADIPPEDPAVYDMICRADTVGVFQIESRAQMAMLPRMRPRTFYDLVIEVAIVRPGPIQGGMVHPYLRRRQGKDPITYPSEAVKEVLERTLGVPIFQEQVMQLAVAAAGFSLGEADQLRRAMAAWKRRGGLEPFERRLIEGMAERGYDEGFARQIFHQIQGFGEYGFPESHSASFALLVYVSAWLKCHEPAAFTAAVLNSLPMGFYAPAQLVRDARSHGVEVRPVDVNASAWDCTLEPGAEAVDKPALRLGFRLIKGFSQDVAMRLVRAREKHFRPPKTVKGGMFAGQPFAHVDELARVAGLSRTELEHLAVAGALQGLVGHRHRARWQVGGVETGGELLTEPRFTEAEPMLRAPTEAEGLVADYKKLGLTLGRHPLVLLRSRLERFRLSTAAELNLAPHGALRRSAGLVINRQRPGTASGVIFMTLEDETGYINLVVWPWVVEKQRREVLHARLLVVYGKVEKEGEVVHLVANRLVDKTSLLGRLETRSRDFG